MAEELRLNVFLSDLWRLDLGADKGMITRVRLQPRSHWEVNIFGAYLAFLVRLKLPSGHCFNLIFRSEKQVGSTKRHYFFPDCARCLFAPFLRLRRLFGCAEMAPELTSFEHSLRINSPPPFFFKGLEYSFLFQIAELMDIHILYSGIYFMMSLSPICRGGGGLRGPWCHPSSSEGSGASRGCWNPKSSFVSIPKSFTNLLSRIWLNIWSS